MLLTTLRRSALLALTVGATVGADAQSSITQADHFTPPPAIPREFRGVWVATVSNIDWPSKPGLPSDVQQRELIAILDRAAALHLNAVILQVRPGADALYASQLEPWSEYLTGEQGRPPSPYYDPLAFAVSEAHKRGLELHAWFNPYRARHPSAKSPNSPTHISVTHPELVRKYGTHLWMDPGEPAVRDYTTRVILDVVRRYDIDGVHIDDYFYPYKERDSSGNLIEFPDSSSYARYRSAGGTLARDDWRRASVDSLVRSVYVGIKAVKPWVKFGISPFGIWRPGNPERIKGFDSYAELYADSRNWLLNGWADYFTPQLYWIIGKPDERYPLLQSWWVSQNKLGRHMWIGNFTSRWPATEILDQIASSRAEPGVTGNIHFSMKSLMSSGKDSLPDRLLAGPYREKALVPASPWLDRTPPDQPSIAVKSDASGGATVAITPGGSEKAWLWLVQWRSGTGWSYDILPGETRSYFIKPHPIDMVVSVRNAFLLADADLVMVSAIDRNGNESDRAILKIDRPTGHAAR